jgi:hypothetical protein
VAGGPWRNGQGALIHRLKDAAGMPCSTCPTPAGRGGRPQGIPSSDAVRIRMGTGDRSPPRLEAVATAKEDEAKGFLQRRRTHGMRPQIAQRVWKTRKLDGRPIKQGVPRVQAERTFAWLQRTYRRMVVRRQRLEARCTAFPVTAVFHRWVQRFIAG